MMLWEILLIIIVILNPIPIYWVFKALLNDFNWKHDKGFILFAGIIFSFLIMLPTIGIGLYFLKTQGILEWISWSWLDFWTTEVSILQIFIGFWIFMISAIIILTIIIEASKEKCSCGKQLRGKYCRKCGKKRDA